MTQVVIALGSNIDPEKNIALAMAWFEEDFNVLKLTEAMKTEPIGMKDPHYFLNAGVLIETELDRNELDKKLRTQESMMGRVRTEDRYASRPIDLDITVWGKEIVDEDIYTRDFLQAIVSDLCPKLAVLR